MCHHYRGARNPPAHLANEFSAHTNLTQLMLPEAGFWPLAQVPIVRQDAAGAREMVAAQWGLLPFWWKPSAKSGRRTGFQRKCINARSETCAAAPAFREAFKRRRCLLPADEFFERGSYFHLEGHRPFALAGLWEKWQSGDETVESCTILTTAANALIRSAGHDRMPVILHNERDYALWLNPDIADAQLLQQLFNPLDPTSMQSYAAPTRDHISSDA